MKNLKKNFHKVEVILSTVGIIIAIILYCLMPITKEFDYDWLIGYLLGFISFKISAKCYFLATKPSKLLLIPLNLKLVFLAGLIYIFHIAGFSAVKIIIGVLISQILATIILLATLHRTYNYQATVQNDSEQLP